MVRRILLFLFSSGLLGAGAWLVWGQFKCVLGLVEGVCYFGGKLAMAGGFMTFLGGYVLWEDFIIRWWSKQKRDE
jgi:hypothetical protein